MDICEAGYPPPHDLFIDIRQTEMKSYLKEAVL